jgi:hypothetical protein
VRWRAALRDDIWHGMYYLSCLALSHVLLGCVLSYLVTVLANDALIDHDTVFFEAILGGFHGCSGESSTFGIRLGLDVCICHMSHVTTGWGRRTMWRGRLLLTSCRCNVLFLLPYHFLLLPGELQPKSKV